MKKLIRYLMMFACIAFAAIVVVVALWRMNNDPVAEKNYTTAPSRMLKMGPVIGGVVSTDTIDDVVIRVEASRLWFNKSKTFGFDNALMKKVAAKDFHLTISKKGEKIIDLSKDQVQMSQDMNTIDINNPRISFPSDMERPDRIRLDKKKMTLHIINGKSEQVWDLANQN